MFRLWFWTARLTGALQRRVAMRFATRLHRASLAKVGHRSRFQPGVRFERPERVVIGAECLFWRGVGAPAEGKDAWLKIGDGVQVNRDAVLDMTGGLALGDGVLVSEQAVIYTHDHGLDPRSAPVSLSKTIERDVWIGMRAVILPSCRVIGAGAVIGAAAVVTRDVPAGAIMAGNPARVIGQRKALGAAA